MKKMVIGMDLGDKKNSVCVLGVEGKIVDKRSIPNAPAAIEKYFSNYVGKKLRVVIEAGTHSPWVSRLLESLGFEVIVADPRRLRAVWASAYKCDKRDAELLARLGQSDVNLLYPVVHRGREAQIDLVEIKARDALVRTRSSLISHVRSIVKSTGARIPKCGAETFHKVALEHMPAALSDGLLSVVGIVKHLTEQIHRYDSRIEKLCEEGYPETWLLREIKGVGPITSLAYVLTIEQPERFAKSRKVGPYLGLVPRSDQSGETARQCRISKAGNRFLRRLLVGSANYILGPFGPDCDLRRYGLELAARGGKKAKNRAAVAVARRLAVLLHRLWRTGEVYDPFYQSKRREAALAH